MDWPMVAALAALAGFGVAFATFWLTFGGRIGQAESNAESAAARSREVEQRMMLLDAAFSTYREHIAREYIHREVMGEVEDRLTQAIDRLGDRMDRFVEKVAK